MKHYTYDVICTFKMQYTFTENEVEQAEDGDDGDLEPTEEAIADLKEALIEHIGFNYPVDELTVESEFDMLLGVEDIID